MSIDAAKRIGQILRKQVELQSEVFSLLSNFKEAITAGDVDRIPAITQQQDILTEQMARLEKERLQIVAKIEGVTNAAAPLTAILQFLPKESHKGLLKIRDELKSAAAKSSTLNKSIQILLQEALTNTKKGVEIIAQTQKKNTGYSQNGKTREFSNNLVNRKG